MHLNLFWYATEKVLGFLGCQLGLSTRPAEKEGESDEGWGGRHCEEETHGGSAATGNSTASSQSGEETDL